ncbi:GNAT family N-acetyltransferase [Kitasatospora sp. NPDC001159]
MTILDAAHAQRGGRLLHAAEGDARTRQRLTNPDTFFFVAESAVGRLIGLAAGMSGRENGGTGPALPGLCHISMVAVHPEHWGKGLGKRLIQALLANGRDYGYDQFQLFTHADPPVSADQDRLHHGPVGGVPSAEACRSSGHTVTSPASRAACGELRVSAPPGRP